MQATNSFIKNPKVDTTSAQLTVSCSITYNKSIERKRLCAVSTASVDYRLHIQWEVCMEIKMKYAVW